MTSTVQRIDQVLWPVFNGPAKYLSDSGELVAWLVEEGFDAHPLLPDDLFPMAEANRLDNVVAIVTGEGRLPPYKTWMELFSQSRVLLLPLQSFDPSFKSAIYTIEKLSYSDLVHGAQANYEWLHRISRANKPFVLKGGGTAFTCEFDDEVNLMAPKIEVLLDPGEIVNVANYLETGVISQADDLTPSFDVNGFFTVPGVAIAHHRQMADDLLPLVAETWEFFAQLHQHNAFPLAVEVEHSRVVSASAGGKDICAELLRFSNPKYELVLTEMAFGTNSGFSACEVDWSINSQLNEGALGIHIAVGEGLTGAHIDLVCPGVQLI